MWNFNSTFAFEVQICALRRYGHIRYDYFSAPKADFF